MKLFGYTDDKDFVRVDLPVATIVQAGIDPWRMDLFDLDPVSIRVGVTWVNFRRLRDIAFAMSINEQLVLCFRDEAEATCICSAQGQYEHSQIKELTIGCFQLSETSFSEHLAQYLKEVDRKRTELSRFNEFDLFARLGAETVAVFSPRSASAVRITAGTIRMALQSPGFDTGMPIYTGRMFEEKTVDVPLPADVNWVFENLGAFNPCTNGVWLPLVSKLDDGVRINVRVPDLTNGAALIAAAEQLPGIKLVMPDGYKPGIEICHLDKGERHYDVTRIMGQSLFKFLHELDQPNAERFSTDALYSVRSNEVRGTRIGFFDVGRKQSRAMSLGALRRLVENRPPLTNIQPLQARGVNMVPIHDLCGEASNSSPPTNRDSE